MGSAVERQAPFSEKVDILKAHVEQARTANSWPLRRRARDNAVLAGIQVVVSPEFQARGLGVDELVGDRFADSELGIRTYAGMLNTIRSAQHVVDIFTATVEVLRSPKSP